MVKGPRGSGGGEKGTEDEYVASQLYIAERASACAEFVSQGRQEQMVAVFDFSSYKSNDSPPLQWQISAMQKVQHLYPERLHKLIVVEPPFWMRTLYHALRSFLPRETQEKIQMVNNR